MIDQKYLNETQDPGAVLGYRIAVAATDVERLVDILSRFGEGLLENLEALP